MGSRYTVPLGKLIQELNLEVLYAPEQYESIPIGTEEVNRPGLQLTGYFDYFVPERVQIIGLAESNYLANLSPEDRRRSLEKLLAYEIPALIVAHSAEVFPEYIELAKSCGRAVLCTPDTTTSVMSATITFLRHMLCPRITRHGVLVEVYGEGLLLLGESGVGKSETAIELVKRGHRLIADDAVELRRLNRRKVIGSAPEMIRHYIELRGIGVVDVNRLFGMSAVKRDADIDVVVNLEPWKDDTVYDRLGLEEQFTKIFDVEIPTLTIPVKPGRNLAVIIEVAAMNNRNKKMGYNAAAEFTKQINEHFDQPMSGSL